MPLLWFYVMSQFLRYTRLYVRRVCLRFFRWSLGCECAPVLCLSPARAARPTLVPQRLPKCSPRPGTEPATLCAGTVLRQGVGADGVERLGRVRTRGSSLEEPGSVTAPSAAVSLSCLSMYHSEGPPGGQEGTCLAAWQSASNRGTKRGLSSGGGSGVVCHQGCP